MNQDQLLLLIAKQLGRQNVGLQDRFMEELGASSLDIVHIVAAVEEKTGVFIPEEMIPELNTPQDILDHISKRNEKPG